MKCSSLLLASLALIAVIGVSGTASAVCVPANTPGGCLNAADKSCGQLGQTMMDGDEKNIVACLKDDAGHLVWKSTSGSGKEIDYANCVNQPYSKSGYKNFLVAWGGPSTPDANIACTNKNYVVVGYDGGGSVKSGVCCPFK